MILSIILSRIFYGDFIKQFYTGFVPRKTSSLIDFLKGYFNLFNEFYFDEMTSSSFEIMFYRFGVSIMAEKDFISLKVH